MTALVVAIWGLAVGSLAGIVALGLLLAMSWALVWGDHPWPDWALPTIGLLSLGAALWLGTAAGKAARSRFRRGSAWQKGFLLVGGIAILGLVAAWLWAERSGAMNG